MSSTQENNQVRRDTPWAQSAETLLDTLNVSPDVGLDDREVRRRRKQHGPNRMREAKPRSALGILVSQFKNTIILVLIGAAAASLVFGQLVDGLAISVAVVINTLIGFVMETRAARSMESLRRMEQITAKALRDGRVQHVAAEELVPGDIVVLEGGDIVSADLRLLEANKAHADESALTGESIPSASRSRQSTAKLRCPNARTCCSKGQL